MMPSLWQQASPNRGECTQRKFHYEVFVKNAPVPQMSHSLESLSLPFSFFPGEHEHG